MKQWEDIVKDKLEGYESTLPEGSLAAFRALREGKAAVPAKKAAPWIWGAAVAIAAGLSAVLFLRQPEAPATLYQIAQPAASLHLPSPVAQAMPLELTRKRQPKAIQKTTVRDIPQEAISVQVEEKEEAPDNQAPENTPASNVLADLSTISIPQEEPVRIKVDSWIVPAAGGILGAGSLTALAANFTLKDSPMKDQALISMRDQLAEWSGRWRYDSGRIEHDLPISQEDSVVSSKHYLPVKAGISARIPLSEKLFITTGLDYSLYTSRFTFTLSGKQTQYVHYLGVPARLDWVFASGKVVDVYLGGGLQGDFCVGATFAGEPLKKDGFSLSLLGSGGIQLNASRRLGFYLEPQLSWQFYTANPTLVTYRSEHPVMFSVATGIRINLGK